MKTILASLIAVTAVASIATAAPRKPEKQPAKKPNFGESFELKSRRASQPRDIDAVATRSLSEHRADRVIKDRVDDLENCWLRLPAGKRVATGATLHLAIEADGTVSAARVVSSAPLHAASRSVLDVEPELPAGVAKCMTTAAMRWTFPTADNRTEIEHGITLTTR